MVVQEVRKRLNRTRLLENWIIADPHWITWVDPEQEWTRVNTKTVTLKMVQNAFGYCATD